MLTSDSISETVSRKTFEGGPENCYFPVVHRDTMLDVTIGRCKGDQPLFVTEPLTVFNGLGGGEGVQQKRCPGSSQPVERRRKERLLLVREPSSISPPSERGGLVQKATRSGEEGQHGRKRRRMPKPGLSRVESLGGRLNGHCWRGAARVDHLNRRGRIVLSAEDSDSTAARGGFVTTTSGECQMREPNHYASSLRPSAISNGREDSHMYCSAPRWTQTLLSQIADKIAHCLSVYVNKRIY
ncbi:hypothetical protein J6590_053976 [Homalodisca vitripennis]|nr:hypothetical protein J6590_053976 [Homalodisca vitripennis]